MKNLIILLACSALLFSSCGGTEEKKQTENKDSIPEVDSSLAILELYFDWKKISREEFYKIPTKTDYAPDTASDPEANYVNQFIKRKIYRDESGALIVKGASDNHSFYNKNDEEMGIYESYYYQGIAGGVAIIHAYYYESSEWIFIDTASGDKHSTWGYPVVSPDGTKMISVNNDLVAGFDPNGIQFFVKDGSKWTKSWEMELIDWGPDDVRWIDDSTIGMIKVVPDMGDGESGKVEYLKLKFK